MHSFTCVLVVVYVARKLRPCPSYSRRRDRINLVLWRSLDKGGGGTSSFQSQGHEEAASAKASPRFPTLNAVARSQIICSHLPSQRPV